MKSMKSGYKISSSSLGNALNMLSLFTIEKQEYTLSELADITGLGYSTIHRLTTTLLEEGFLARDSMTKKVRLGSSLLAFEKIILSYYDICSYSRPLLEKLVHETGESAHLTIIKNNKVVYLQKVDNINYITIESYEGKQNPIHATSSGQTILAFQSKTAISSVINNGLTRFTQHTITNPIQFTDRLLTIKQQGYAYSKEELHNGISSIAAPVKSQYDDVRYAIGIAGPTTRIHNHKIMELIKYVKEAALKLSSL
jgi:DNA-binding IclR family transcriptional regulator